MNGWIIADILRGGVGPSGGGYPRADAGAEGGVAVWPAGYAGEGGGARGGGECEGGGEGVAGTGGGGERGGGGGVGGGILIEDVREAES